MSTVCSEVKNLKNNRQRAAEPPAGGMVQSTPAQSTVFMPPNSGGVTDDEVVTGLSWPKKMGLMDEFGENPADNSTGDQSESNKVHLTQIQESTKKGLRKAFYLMNNTERRQLWQQLIMPDTVFIMSPCLNEIKVAECSKSTKSPDYQLLQVQALFLDAIEPLSELFDSINQGTEATLNDMESVVKAVLTFMGNTSSTEGTGYSMPIEAEYREI